MHFISFGRLRVALCLLFGTFSLVSYSQNVNTAQDTTSLNAIQKITEATISAAAKRAPTVQSAPLQVVERETIEKLGYQNLHEVVRGFSGVNIRDYGGIGGLKTVSIRSLGAQHTAVSYDGVSMSNAQSGQVDISRFSLDNIEQVSLFIGSSDDIFQSARLFASAGALQVKTLKPIFEESPLNLTAQMKVASFGTYNPALLYEQRLGSKWSMSVNGDWLTSRGNYPFVVKNIQEVTTRKRENSDVNNLRSEVNIYGDFGRGGNISFKGNYFYSQRGLPGSVILYKEEARERLWERNGFFQSSYNVDLSSKWALKSSLKYNYAWNRYIDKGDKYKDGMVEDIYSQREYYFSVATRYQATERLQFSLAQDVFVNTLWATIPECPFPERLSSLSAFAAQYKTKRVTLTASLLGTYVTEKVEFGPVPSDRKRLSPSVSLSYKLFSDKNFRVRASYQDIFRVPTFNDLYYARMGNTNLENEKARQFNLGLTWSGALFGDVFEYASISVDGYYNKVKDKIVAVPTLFIWKMRNVGQVEIIGGDVNVAAKSRLGESHFLEFAGNYTYQYAIDLTNPSAKNYKHQIPYTPVHAGNASFSWVNPWVNVGFVVSAVGKRYSLPQNIAANMIDGYAEHTISLNHNFEMKKWSIRVQGEVVNIFDCMYDVIQYYPMPGRSYRLTLKINI